jgi:uncharacterized protein (TIGR00730 family)
MTTKMTSSKFSVCVYCGSGKGTEPGFEKAAIELGTTLGKMGYPLIYGGGSIGLMGATARACLDAGGHVTGIIPEFLTKNEIVMRDVSELIITEDMHERKMKMFQRSDAFVVLPGGIGTLEEVVEMMSWCQLGHHKKPILLANINDFWSPFRALIKHMRDKEFIRKDYDASYEMFDTITEIMDALTRAAER